MKSFVISVLAVLSLLCTASAQEDPQFNLPPNYEWIAPDWPAGEAPYWYDYGWDSPSNGPVPAEIAQRAAQSQFASSRVAMVLPTDLPMSVSRPYTGTEPLPAIQLAQAKAGPPPPPPLPVATPHQTAAIRGKDRPGNFYTDQFIGLATPDFKETSFTYGLGVGYQVSPHWGFDARISHHGLDLEGSAVQDIGGRIVARMPFRFLSPYTFLGGEFDLERDRWHILPGAGIEITPSKTSNRLALFVEGALRADLDGRNDYQFITGARWRLGKAIKR